MGRWVSGQGKAEVICMRQETRASLLSTRGLHAQVAASSEVSVVAVEDVPSEVVQRETDIEMGKEDILKKPENIR